MTLFWIIAAAMILVALILLAPALLRSYGQNADGTERFNVEIAREHLDELVRQRAAGDLSDEEFAQAKEDLEVALAQDLEGPTSGPAPSRSGGKSALLIAAILLPLITVPLYLEIGSPHLIEGLPGNTVAAQAGHGQGDLPPMDELVVRLRERMETNPDNAEGWFLLGRTYMRLQNYPDAVYAFEKVVALLPDESAGLLALADAMAMRDGRRVGARGKALLQKALQIDPNAVTAMWLLGNAAMDEGNTASALDYWQRAYPLLADEPSMQAELGQMITRAGGQLPATSTGVAALPPIMPTAGARAAGAQDAPPAEAAEGATIVVEVALAPALMEKTAAGDTVFVLARAESGPPMPLAVARHQVAELPLRVTLTDAMAMMPAMRLSAFERVKVTAKVSKSGQAGSQPGDLIAGDVVVDQANPPASVQLLIDQVIE